MLPEPSVGSNTRGERKAYRARMERESKDRFFQEYGGRTMSGYMRLFPHVALFLR